MENQTVAKENKKSNEKLYLVLMFVFLAVSGVLAWLYMAERGKVEVITEQKAVLDGEKMAVEAELTDMLAQYDTIKTENEEMKAQIEEQKQKIMEMLEEAEKHKNDAWIIYKLKKETGTLREVMKSYLVTIDSLNTLNVELTAQKHEVEQALGAEKKRTEELNQANEDLAGKVAIGARLKAVDMTAYAQRVKSNGVHRETDRASKADKIKCCFTIDKNEIAEPGKREVFVRIISPNGSVLSLEKNKEAMFDFEGVRGLYSVRKQVVYENEELDLCLYWDVINELVSGEYIVEAYSGESRIGTTKIQLK